MVSLDNIRLLYETVALHGYNSEESLKPLSFAPPPPSLPLHEVSSCQHEVDQLCPHQGLSITWPQALEGTLGPSPVTTLDILHVLSLVQKWLLLLKVSASTRILHLAFKVLPQLSSPCLINDHPVAYSDLILSSLNPPLSIFQSVLCYLYILKSQLALKLAFHLE